jgi:hypothetical protein
MFIGLHIKWYFPIVLLLTFVMWSLVSAPFLSVYAQIVTQFAQMLLNQIQPHQVQVIFTSAYPEVSWQNLYPYQASSNESVSFSLLSYNLLLYFALLCSVPEYHLKQRALLLLSGVPFFFVFQVADLLLVVESKLLAQIQPHSYVFWVHLDLWFVMVKFCHSFSVMAAKQLYPFLVFFILCQRFNKYDGPKTALS